MTAGFSTPDWVKDAVFYQIFPDRFAKSDGFSKPTNNLEPWESPPTYFGFKGGDLPGITTHLDYLVDLGINAIYLNPIFQSASNHRYHTHDYYRVDPLLGGNPAFRTLLDAAHQRGIRIVLDGVFNHASRGFFQFNHILETGPSSPYLDWFTIKGFPLNAYQGKPNYECWANLPALPKLNVDNPQVQQFIFDVARYWLEQGIDGWRLDVPFEIKSDRFWQDFRRLVKETNPQAYLVGEIPFEAQHWLQGDQFDAAMNYPFTQACLGFFASKSLNRRLEAGMMGLPPAPRLDAPAFARRVGELLQIYPRPAVLAQLNLLDSHDTPRFLSLAGGDSGALRLATLFQMTYPGAPCIYYGDEIGMEGGRDPDCRRGFPWDSSRWDHSLRGYFKRCVALRHAHPCLRSSDFTTLYAADQVLAYERRLGDEVLVVLINNSEEPCSLAIPEPARAHASAGWVDLLEDGDGPVAFENVTIPPRSGMVLAPLR